MTESRYPEWLTYPEEVPFHAEYKNLIDEAYKLGEKTQQDVCDLFDASKDDDKLKAVFASLVQEIKELLKQATYISHNDPTAVGAQNDFFKPKDKGL
jgi:hypothetical protein